MGQGLDMRINRLPAMTWNWLNMNQTDLSQVEAGDPWHPKIEGVQPEKGETGGDFSSIATGMGPDMDQLAERAGNPPLRIRAAEGGKRETARLRFPCEDGIRAFQQVDILAEENSTLTIIMEYTSPGEAKGLAAVQTRIQVEKGAKVRLIQLQLLGSGYTVLNDIGAVCGEGASVEVLQLFLGASRTYAGLKANLQEKESSLGVEVGYLGRRDQIFDMNYMAEHWGKKSVSSIRGEGVLQENASKLFRGTIDFKTGSSGSEGDEKEDVLLLGEDAVNQSIPLILCAEEDVQGNHGATIGKLDDELLFYLCSRGMTEEEALNMMTRARMDSLCGKIGDPAAEERVQSYLNEVIFHEAEN